MRLLSCKETRSPGHSINRHVPSLCNLDRELSPAVSFDCDGRPRRALEEPIVTRISECREQAPCESGVHSRPGRRSVTQGLAGGEASRHVPALQTRMGRVGYEGRIGSRARSRKRTRQDPRRRILQSLPRTTNPARDSSRLPTRNAPAGHSRARPGASDGRSACRSRLAVILRSVIARPGMNLRTKTRGRTAS